MQYWKLACTLRSAQAPLVVDDLVRYRDVLECSAYRQAWATVELQRCRCEDLLDHEGALRDGAQVDDGFRRSVVNTCLADWKVTDLFHRSAAKDARWNISDRDTQRCCTSWSTVAASKLRVNVTGTQTC